MGIELSPGDRWDLLERNMVMRLATADPEGRPHVTPIWYVADRDAERVYFSTPEDTRKARDVAERPAVSLTVDEGQFYFDLRAVVCYGTATVLDNQYEREDVEQRWCEKYFDAAERPEFMDVLYEGRPWEWFAVDPGSWRSWDNRQIDLERLYQKTR